MYSLGEVSRQLDLPYKRLTRWVRELGLGKKLGGWTVVLSSEDIAILESKLNGQNNKSA